jgi:cytochrome c oxidase subunit 1
MDCLILSIHLAGIASIISAINFISTILLCSTINIFDFDIMPIFPFSMFVTSLLIIVAIPVLAGCITLLLLDRHFNCNFYSVLEGGDALLFQHLF